MRNDEILKSIFFEHIFFRDFYLEENEIEAEKQKQKEYLTKEEIVDLLADAKIKWRDEDIIFGKKLLNECEKYFEFITTIIKNVSENWDYDRINIIDKTIIIICCSEMIGFSDIPVRATINEAVELAKKFSTDKSFIFVNAVVEKIKKHLMDENLIQKSERGSK